MKRIFILLMIIMFVKMEAQTYQISFTGTGASGKVDSVIVENLTQCKNLSLNGSDILNLTVTTGINEIRNNTDNDLFVYPNPMNGNCLIEFDLTEPGETTFNLYDIAGKRITQVQELLMKGSHIFTLSGFGSGIYILKVVSNQSQFNGTAKIISSNLSSGFVELKHLETEDIMNSEFKSIQSLKSNKSSKNMQYTTGDILKFTGISGIYRTVFMLIPTKSQTVTFNFIQCTDGANNNYPVVQIGTQTWMEENLRTTKYNNGTSIPLVTDNSAWMNISTPAYCWYNNDSLAYKSSTYGALYDWYAASNNICPTGWHLPDTTEWYKLVNFLGGWSIAGGKMKEVCSSDWPNYYVGATNSSGFSGLPGGYRNFFGSPFGDHGLKGYWWSANEYNPWGTPYAAWFSSLSYNNQYADLVGNNNKSYGYSVRCVKN